MNLQDKYKSALYKYMYNPIRSVYCQPFYVVPVSSRSDARIFPDF